jgi:RND family efflux transporter MFP subunit
MKRKVKRALLITGILAIAVAGSFGLSKMKPPPETKDVAAVDPLVQVLELEATEVQFSVASQGTVRPRTQTVLSAEISGAIVSISPKFIAGGVFRAGEELLRIDPTNYEVAVNRAEATLKQRQIEFDGAEKLLSKGYRAESEYASAAAALAAAEADLVNARRNLERTRISLPYDGMVRSKDADLGQYVNPGTRLGVTFATDYAEVRLPLTDQDLAFVDLPSASEIRIAGSSEGPLVTLSATQKGAPQSWTARIVRSEGVVDESNRVTYAVAQIADPYRLSESDSPEPPLPMGTFVAARIEGATAGNLIRVPRSALRTNSQLMFVDKENRLRMGMVTVVRADAEYAYIRDDGLIADRISITVLEAPISGMKVRTSDDPPADSDETAQLAKGETS